MSGNAWRPKQPAKIPKGQFPQSKTKLSNVEINPDEYDDMILQNGVRVKVYRTMLCPNVNSIDSAEHPPGCSICQGAGFLDVHPKDSVAWINSQKLEKVHRSEGYVDDSKVMGTFLRGIELQYFTLVELVDFTEIYFQRIQRQQGQLDHLKYQAKCVNVVVDQNGKEYYQETDFRIDPNGSIKWKTGKGPSQGTIYSIHYEAAIQYRATRGIHVNRFVQTSQKSPDVTMLKMNEAWELQKDYLVERVDQSGNELEPNLINNE